MLLSLLMLMLCVWQVDK